MWLLDLFGDSNPIWSKTASFYGHPFIFCTLLNFGGQQGIVGNTPRIASGMDAALAQNSTISGVGITMEGIWTNYKYAARSSPHPTDPAPDGLGDSSPPPHSWCTPSCWCNLV
jgi:hypothetical protein